MSRTAEDRDKASHVYHMHAAAAAAAARLQEGGVAGICEGWRIELRLVVAKPEAQRDIAKYWQLDLEADHIVLKNVGGNRGCDVYRDAAVLIQLPRHVLHPPSKLQTRESVYQQGA